MSQIMNNYRQIMSFFYKPLKVGLYKKKNQKVWGEEAMKIKTWGKIIKKGDHGLMGTDYCLTLITGF